MNRRRRMKKTGTILIVCAAALGLAAMGARPNQAQVRLSFQIATGGVAGTYYPIGQMLASIISHPPGVARCEVAGRCGPEGLLAAAKASQGSVANAQAVNDGRVASALVQADIAADAYRGMGSFKGTGGLPNLRAVADLFPELVHLVARKGAKIARLADLKRRRVSIDTGGSGTQATVRKILAAAGLNETNVKFVFENPERSAAMLGAGELDAFFVVGGPPFDIITELAKSDAIALVPLEGRAMESLVKTSPELRVARVPENVYPGIPATKTLSVAAIWVVGANTSDDLVYAITRALWNPANRVLLDSGHPMGVLIRPETATMNLPIPLHPGAERFYRELQAPSPIPQ